MATIIGIAGSLRRASFNRMLLRGIAESLPAGTTLEIASIADIPLYNADIESEQGIPAPVQVLKDRIAAADGLLLATPEYNNSMSGVLKNTIDWLSRPPSDIGRVFKGLPTGFLGATPGFGGTLLAQSAWLPVLRILGVLPFFEGRVIVPGAAKVFDNDGRLVDTAIAERVREYAQSFAVFVEQRRRSRG